MNGAIKAANKNIKRLVEKMVETHKDWHEKLSLAPHAYPTSVQTSTNATPVSFVYGIKAVLTNYMRQFIILKIGVWE